MASDGSLQLTPPDTLKFRFELKKQIPALLKLTNPGATSVAFKVKTTSPKKYVVRPNTGVVPPGGVAEVQVVMQQQKEYPPDLANCKDKFLVQSCAVTSTQAAQLAAPGSDAQKKAVFEAVFPAVEAGSPMPASVKEAKLRVAYISPAPPPSPVAEEGAGGAEGASPVGTPAFSPSAPGTDRAEAALANRELNAAVNSSVKLQKEMQQLNTQCTTLKAQLAERDAKLAQLRAGGASGRGVVPFTLVHLLLTALIAFVLGRYL